MSVSPSVAKNTVMTYLLLHLIVNKTLEVVYENAPEYTSPIVKYFEKKSKIFCREGIAPLETSEEGNTVSHTSFSLALSALRFSFLDPNCFFDKSNTECIRESTQ